MRDVTLYNIEKAISENKSIAIIGQQGSGKSTLFNEISEMARSSGSHYKVLIDEVAGNEDQKYLVDTINRGQSAIFTHHAKNKEFLLKVFPGLSKDNICVVKTVWDQEDGSRYCMVL